MEDKQGFDSVEAIVILIGVLIVGGSILLTVAMTLANTHHGGLL